MAHSISGRWLLACFKEEKRKKELVSTRGQRAVGVRGSGDPPSLSSWVEQWHSAFFGCVLTLGCLHQVVIGMASQRGKGDGGGRQQEEEVKRDALGW